MLAEKFDVALLVQILAAWIRSGVLRTYAGDPAAESSGELSASVPAEDKPRFPGLSWWRALMGRLRREDRESYACYALMVRSKSTCGLSGPRRVLRLMPSEPVIRFQHVISNCSAKQDHHADGTMDWWCFLARQLGCRTYICTCCR